MESVKNHHPVAFTVPVHSSKCPGLGRVKPVFIHKHEGFRRKNQPGKFPDIEREAVANYGRFLEILDMILGIRRESDPERVPLHTADTSRMSEQAGLACPWTESEMLAAANQATCGPLHEFPFTLESWHKKDGHNKIPHIQTKQAMS
jgi:hypothetical protein